VVVGMARQGIGRGPGAARAGLALVCALAWISTLGVSPLAAQGPVVITEQWLQGLNSSGYLSATLDPARRYGLQVLPVIDGGTFRGTYSQSWFLRDGSRRAGNSEGTLVGRAPWEQELLLPTTGLSQWTVAAGFWNEGHGVLLVRLLDLGPR
jgi:hypothetical protein